jgi:hypothetical protein
MSFWMKSIGWLVKAQAATRRNVSLNAELLSNHPAELHHICTQLTVVRTLETEK